MKGRFVATAFLLTIVFIACSKEKINPGSLSASSARMSIIPEPEIITLYSSGWESVSNWNIKKENAAAVLSASRPTPQLSKSVIEKGAVVVFARNLWNDDPEFKDMPNVNKPLMMPFYFMPYFEQPDYTEQWNYKADGNKIDLYLNINGETTKSAPGKDIQFRFIIIPEKVLKEKGHTAASLRKLSYEKLVQTFSLQP